MSHSLRCKIKHLCHNGTITDSECDRILKALEQESKILEILDFAIDASSGDTNYFVGFRNGLRYAKSLIDGEEPQYESCNETLSILDCAKKIKEHCTNAKWCFDCELGNGDGTCKLADNEYCYSLPNEWKLEEEEND